MKKILSVKIDEEVTDRARNAVYWTPGTTLNSLVEAALTAALDHLEKKRGAPFQPRQTALRTGRQISDK